MTRLLNPFRHMWIKSSERPCHAQGAIPANRLASRRVVSRYDRAKRASISRGLWFCAHRDSAGRFLAWALPPFAIESDFTIKANGIPCEIEPVREVAPFFQDFFDRFDIPDLSKRYVFHSSIPSDVDEQEIKLTCEFGDKQWFPRLTTRLIY
jgi:hypothetical protein